MFMYGSGRPCRHQRQATFEAKAISRCRVIRRRRDRDRESDLIAQLAHHRTESPSMAGSDIRGMPPTGIVGLRQPELPRRSPPAKIDQQQFRGDTRALQLRREGTPDIGDAAQSRSRSATAARSPVCLRLPPATPFIERNLPTGMESPACWQNSTPPSPSRRASRPRHDARPQPSSWQSFTSPAARHRRRRCW